MWRFYPIILKNWFDKSVWVWSVGRVCGQNVGTLWAWNYSGICFECDSPPEIFFKQKATVLCGTQAPSRKVADV